MGLIQFTEKDKIKVHNIEKFNQMNAPLTYETKDAFKKYIIGLTNLKAYKKDCCILLGNIDWIDDFYTLCSEIRKIFPEFKIATFDCNTYWMRKIYNKYFDTKKESFESFIRKHENTFLTIYDGTNSLEEE